MSRASPRPRSGEFLKAVMVGFMSPNLSDSKPRPILLSIRSNSGCSFCFEERGYRSDGIGLVAHQHVTAGGIADEAGHGDVRRRIERRIVAAIEIIGTADHQGRHGDVFQ